MASPKTIILITGANSGIGKATAKLLAATSNDYHVLIGSRSALKGQAAVDDITSSTATKGTLSVLELDVDSEASINAAAATIQQDYGRLDVLINNAGHVGMEAEGLAAKIRACFATNALGAVLVTEAFKPLLLASAERGYAPRIIFVSSAQGSVNFKLDPVHPWAKSSAVHYRMSKAAENMAAITYQVELRDKGVKVHAVCPGLVDTNFRRGNAAPPGMVGPETSAETLLGVLKGERDSEAGKLVHKDGVYDW